MKIGTASFMLLVIFCFSAPAGAQDARDPLAELKACARIPETAARTACYDSLGKQVIAAERAAEAGNAASAPQATAAKATAAVVAPQAAAAATAAPASAAAVESKATAATAAPVLSDEIGGQGFAEPEEEVAVENRGRVVACKLNVNDKYYFTFENGQVWFQTQGQRIRLGKSCDFLVTISKDKLGYKMQIDGDKGKIRVKRVR